MPTNCVNRTKIVVRKLPPSYTSEEFLKYVSPLEEHSYYHFVPGAKSVDQFSRAYFNFLNFEDTILFKDRYDGYVFLDQKGEEFIAQVEFAPYQKIPSGRGKIETMTASILQDPEYLRFLENLKKTDETGKLTETLIDNLEAFKAKQEAEQEITPLVEFLKSKEDRKHGRDDKRLRRSERSERSERSDRVSRPPKSKASRSRKERQRDRMSDRKSKSVTENKIDKGTDGKTTDKINESKGSTGDGKAVHVETIINNTKADKKDNEGKHYSEDSKQDKGRGRHSYEKQRKTLNPSYTEEFSKPFKSFEKSFSSRDKPLKILLNPNKESFKMASRSELVTGKSEVTSGKNEIGTGKTDAKDVNSSCKSDLKSGREDAKKERMGERNEGRKERGAERVDVRKDKIYEKNLESADGKKSLKEDVSDKKPRVRNRDRPERAIYKPGPRRKE